MISAPRAITEFVHNTDLNPGEKYLATVPRLRAALHYPVLLDAFNHYDRVANSKQIFYRSAGIASLCLAGIALVGVTFELFLSAIAVTVPWYVTILLEVFAAASIFLALLPTFGGTRSQWLTARFMTEQIRQWHFQMLLDGSLLSKLRGENAEFEAERDKRWARFMARGPDAEGAMNSFVDAESIELHHPVKPYSDSGTAEESVRAYVDLRFQRQLAYFKFKREYFAVRDEWSEAFARWMILFALMLTAGQLVLVAVRRLTGTDAWHTASASMSAAALVFAILSAILRVYQNAMAFSPQRERYESKWVRLVALRAAYDMASTTEKKLAIMKEVELVEIEELREFLRQMRRASYLL